MDSVVAAVESLKGFKEKSSTIYSDSYAYGVLTLFEYYASLEQKESPPCKILFESLDINSYYKLGKK